MHTICTRTLPAVHVPPAELARVRATYLARYFAAAPPLRGTGATGGSPPGIGRRPASWRATVYDPRPAPSRSPGRQHAHPVVPAGDTGSNGSR